MDSLKEIIESILFVAGESVDFDDIASKLNVPVEEVINATKQLQKEKQENFSGIQVQIFNNKAQLCSNPNYAEFITEVLNPIKEKALTKAVLEVAAIVAYKQPITRLEIDQVRGVNSDYSINVLLENNLIEIVGRKDAIGKPLLYGTTDNFLKRFNLESINDLPDYEELLNRIKIIKNPDNSLFDFSNIPSPEKETETNNENNENQELQESILHTETAEDELEQLEKEIDKETIHAFFNTLKSENNSQSDVNENKIEETETSINNEENLEVEEEDINYQNLISALNTSKELVSDSDLL